MQIKSLLFTALAASGAVARRTCGVTKPTEEQKLISQNFQLEEAAQRESGNFSISAAATLDVNLYYHVVATAQTTAGGYLTQAQLTRQTDVLNDAFAPHGISFTQAGVDWTVNSNWARDTAELTMKRALRKGTYADLNVYLLASSEYLGYAYFPQAITAGSTQFYRDGVVVVSSTLPGGTFVPYNEGHTLTHEVGHWFGLDHTFGDDNGECTGTGDFVDDTPFEATAAFECQIGRDSCPNAPGLDPVTNYMDYSDDACFTGFTAGQEARVYSFWDAYRAQYQ